MRNIIKKNIVDLCKRKGISVSALERATGMGSKTIARWDRFSPTIDNLATVADYFGVSIDMICGRVSVTDQELRLLATFRTLSDEGKTIALNQMDFYSGIYKNLNSAERRA